MRPLTTFVFLLSLTNIANTVTVKEIVTVDKEILGGIPVFKNTRVPLKNLFDYLESGDSIDDFLADFDYIPKEHCVFLVNASKLLLENLTK